MITQLYPSLPRPFIQSLSKINPFSSFSPPLPSLQQNRRPDPQQFQVLILIAGRLLAIKPIPPLIGVDHLLDHVGLSRVLALEVG